MPVTFPAHQAGVLPLKVWKPKWFDGLALVVGAGSPDLFLTLNHNPRFDAHGVTGVVVAVAFTIVYATLFRRYSADGLFGSLPDFGPLRCSSYRVLRVGRPRLLVTTFSAFVGVLNHIFIDSFTHAGRLGSRTLGFDHVLVDEPVTITVAKVLQYLGHTVGSLIGILLFVVVVSNRHLGEWYGQDTIERFRNAPTADHAGWITGAIVLAGVTTGLVWGWPSSPFPIFHMGLGLALSLFIAGAVNGQRTTRSKANGLALRRKSASEQAA